MLPPGLPVHLHDSSSRSSPRPKKKSHSRIPWNPYPPSVTTAKRLRILFYHKHEPYFGFTNFSNHPVGYKGVMYPTSEHLFQCLKVNVVCYRLSFSLTILQFLPDRPDLAHHILNCSRPSVALSEARRYQPAVRPDWKQVNLKMVHFLQVVARSSFSTLFRWTKRCGSNLHSIQN